MTEENRAILDLENVRHMIDTHSSGHLAIDNAQAEITRLTEALAEAMRQVREARQQRERMRVLVLEECEFVRADAVRQLQDMQSALTAAAAAQATIAKMREALEGAIFCMEAAVKIKNPEWDGYAAGFSPIGKARAALASPAEKEG